MYINQMLKNFEKQKKQILMWATFKQPITCLVSFHRHHSLCLSPSPCFRANIKIKPTRLHLGQTNHWEKTESMIDEVRRKKSSTFPERRSNKSKEGSGARHELARRWGSDMATRVARAGVGGSDIRISYTRRSELDPSPSI